MPIDNNWWRTWTRQPGNRAPLNVQVVGAADAPTPPEALQSPDKDDLPAAYLPTTGVVQGPLRLRDYQQDAIEAVSASWQSGKRAPLIVMPCGTGKTIIAAEIISRMYLKHEHKALFLAHRRELLDQTAEKVRLVSPDTRVGVVQAKRNELGRNVTIASIQTVGHHSGRRLQELLDHGPYPLVICDEAHHAVTRQWMNVLNALREAGSGQFLMGMTATPGRADGTALDQVFDDVAFERNTFDMVDAGWLVPPKGFKITLDIDLDRVDTRKGDFVQSQLSKVMNTEHVNAAVVRAWQQNGHDRKTLVFGVDIAHTHALSSEFQAAGYSSEALDSTMKAKDRHAALQRFREGATKLLVNCEILTEGFDEPSVEAILFARPTQSQGLYIQVMGRGLRLYPGKTECLVVDCVGNSDRHPPVQLASLAGFDPLEAIAGGRGDGEEVVEEADLDVRSAEIIASEEVAFSRLRTHTRYKWRETTLGWVLQIPRIGYFLVAWVDRHHHKATIRFFDQRPNRRDDPPRDVLQEPVEFELAYGLVEAEMDRIFNARNWRKGPEYRERDASLPDMTTFVDLEDGLNEEMFLEETMLKDAAWREKAMSTAQAQLLVKLGVKKGSLPSSMGEASDLIAILQVQKDAKMRVPATHKQLAYLRVNGLPIGPNTTKGAAMKLIFKHRKGIPI